MGSLWRLFRCDPRSESGEECHPSDFGNVTPGAGLDVSQPEDSGHMIPGAWSMGSHHGDHGCVTPGFRL